MDRKLAKLVKFMRKNGVLEYKTPELALTLSPLSLFPHKELAEVAPDKPMAMPEFTEEQLLMWSADQGVGAEGVN